MVSANCRKNWPVMPLMNAVGTKTAREHQRHGDDGAAHFVHRLARGVARRSCPLAM